MSHLSSIGAGLFSDLSVHHPATRASGAGTGTSAAFTVTFATALATVPVAGDLVTGTGIAPGAQVAASPAPTTTSVTLTKANTAAVSGTVTFTENPALWGAYSTFSQFSPFFATEVSTGSPIASLTPTSFVRMKNVRSFPAVGTPPNIVNVGAYGQTQSSQIAGQADAPQLEITLNLVVTDWASDPTIVSFGNWVKDGTQKILRFSVLNAQPTGTGATQYASTSAGLGTVENSQYFWLGKVESFLVTPNLTDSNTSTVTLSIQGQFYGAYTN